MLDYAIDQLLVYPIRAWLSHTSAPLANWAVALNDPFIGRVLALMDGQQDVR